MEEGAAARPTIVVIDDDEVVRDSLRALLESRRFAVWDYESADAFLARRNGEAAGCLVLDVHMPGMTGPDLLQRLRADGDRTPAILVTGRRDTATEMQASRLGVVALLDKPVSHGVLFAAIAQAIGGR